MNRSVYQVKPFKKNNIKNLVTQRAIDTHMNDTTPKITVAHFSFANALRDSQNGASPVHRLEAIYSFFAWAQTQAVDLIGCTEGKRAQDGIDWNVVLLHIEQKYRYRCIASALQGDKSVMAFANQLFVRLDDRPENPFPAWPQGWYELTLTPDELTGTRHAVTASVLIFGWPMARSVCSSIAVSH